MTKVQAKIIRQLIEETLKEVYTLLNTPTKKQKEFFDLCEQKLQKLDIKK